MVLQVVLTLSLVVWEQEVVFSMLEEEVVVLILLHQLLYYLYRPYREALVEQPLVVPEELPVLVEL